jgi:hypothetical protein
MKLTRQLDKFSERLFKFNYECARVGVPEEVRRKYLDFVSERYREGLRGKELRSTVKEWLEQNIDKKDWIDILVKLLPLVLQIIMLFI